MDYFIPLLIVAFLILILTRILLRKIIIFDYERGLLFQNGIFNRLLEPGRYWYSPRRSTIQKIDIRLKTVSIPSQEVLSADNVTIKITLAAQYFISDPVIAMTKVEKYSDAFYMTLQLALREIVGTTKIDDIIANRQEIGKKVFEKTAVKVKEFGLTLQTVDVKDIMFPGDLKNIFAQVVKAQKEGQAILEKARGESAALRNLANAAKMLEGNPTLMQLRALQSVESGKGNTIVIGLPPETIPILTKKPTQDPVS